MGINMKDNLQQEFIMVREYKAYRMEMYMKDNSKMENIMAMVS